MAQVFISYRRNGGEALARLLHDNLTKKHFSVFYDIESLSSELFSQRLLKEIEECTDFILILSPNALDRCKENEDDWVRRELSHALRQKKNIIPVLMRGFCFPADLPEDIRQISECHGIEFDAMTYLDARLKHLCKMMDSKPRSPLSLLSPLSRAAGKPFSVLWRGFSKACGFVVQTLPRRIAFFLAILIASLPIFCNTLFSVLSSSDPYLSPQPLIESNHSLKTVPLSSDHKYLATCDDGVAKVFNLQNSSPDLFGQYELPSDLAKEGLSLAYQEKTGELWALGSSSLVIYTQNAPLRLDFAPPCDSEQYQAEIRSLFFERDSKHFAVEWTLSPRKAAEDSHQHRMAFYEMKEENGRLAPFSTCDLTNLQSLGFASGNRYLIYFKAVRDGSELHRNLILLDLKTGKEADSPVELLRGMKPEALDLPVSQTDPSRRYLAVRTERSNSSDEGYYDVTVWDLQKNDEYLATSPFCDPYVLEVNKNGTLLLTQAEPSAEETTEKRRPHSVISWSFLNNEAPSSLLSADEFSSLIADKDSSFDLYDFAFLMIRDTRTLAVSSGHLVSLLDLDKKEKVATVCAPPNAPCRSYGIQELADNLVLWLEDRENHTPTCLSVYTFSLEKQNGALLLPLAKQDSAFYVVSFLPLALLLAAVCVINAVGERYEKKRLALAKNSEAPSSDPSSSKTTFKEA